MRIIAAILMLALGWATPSQSHALSCVSPQPKHLFFEKAIGLAVDIHQVEEKEPNQMLYQGTILQSWHPHYEAGQTISLSGTAIGPWASFKLDKNKPYILGLRLNEEALSFGPCSFVEAYDAKSDTVKTLNKLYSEQEEHSHEH